MSDQQSSQEASQQQQARVRKHPFADWPTIKILTPPQGRYSPKADEWCITYCSQSISGRVHGREPDCRSICIRKVFPHEVRNVIAFKRHEKADAEGNVKYPLPAEGQTANLPRLLGGRPDDADDERPTPQSKPTTKFWEEGWYFWTSTGRQAARDKLNMMQLDLQKQQMYSELRQEQRELWQDYQESLRKGVDSNVLGGRMPASVVVSSTAEIQRAKSLLIHLPPDLPPLWERINKLLAPSYRALSILRESITSGEQRDFAVRVWEKAQTDEPFELARRTFSRTYERWKNKDAADEDDGKKGST
ncbi:hypothetical protein EST38_g6640 [Candolleomyces aberdarensis]|uniref:Uncharacterized protein n=1 Tax=Candolleomyces aberdarensis TaxID=2316362 RepID=A0A4V1Q3N5_9AGAR|nr:hypothetical protein EST38_g6640 [Candolleomyces aberdarensis]